MLIAFQATNGYSEISMYYVVFVSCDDWLISSITYVAFFTDSFLKQMVEEKDQLEGQVNFLNSLIVDMQRKNDELKSRIEIFEMGNVSDDTKANM